MFCCDPKYKSRRRESKIMCPQSAQRCIKIMVSRITKIDFASCAAIKSEPHFVSAPLAKAKFDTLRRHSSPGGAPLCLCVCTLTAHPLGAHLAVFAFRLWGGSSAPHISADPFYIWRAAFAASNTTSHATLSLSGSAFPHNNTFLLSF